MPVELLQFGAVAAVLVVIALLWYRFVYKARRTGEGDGATRERRQERPGDDEKRE